METNHHTEETNGGLIESISDETQMTPVVRVQSSEEFLMIAHSCESREEIHSFTPLEKFHYEIYTEVLDDAGYLFRQSKLLFRRDFPWKNIKKIEQRLNTRIAALSHGLDYSYKHIEARLYSKKETDVATAVFILSSVDASNDSSMPLDRVLKVFSRTEDSYLPAFVEGLKHGLNPEINSRLFCIIEQVNSSVKSACFEIIKYRNDFETEQFTNYMSLHDARLLAGFPITIIGQLKQLTEMFLTETASDLNSPVHEAVLWSLFILNSPETHDLCRKTCREKPEEYPISIELLAMTGTERDKDLIISLCSHPSSTVRKAGYRAVGILGFTSFVPFLIQQLSEENQKDESSLISETLTRITGALPIKDDSVDESEKNPCLDADAWQEWWDINHRFFETVNGDTRWKHGKAWSLECLVDEMESMESNYDARQKAWKELVLRSGRTIPFEADWNVDKQLAAIMMWRESLKE